MAKTTPISTKMVKVDSVDKVKHHVFQGAFILLYLLYFLVFVGVSFVNVEYISRLTFIIHLVICLFLLWRFNPLMDHVLLPFDADIIFTSALILLVNVLSTEFGTDYIKNVVKYVQQLVKTDVSDAIGLSSSKLTKTT